MRNERLVIFLTEETKEKLQAEAQKKDLTTPTMASVIIAERVKKK